MQHVAEPHPGVSQWVRAEGPGKEPPWGRGSSDDSSDRVRGEFRPMNIAVMTQVVVAPILMLMTWKHSIGPCAQDQLDPEAFIDSFLDMALNGLLPSPVPAPLLAP
jgi:hypothetical protein